MEKKNVSKKGKKKNLLSTIEEIVKILDYDTTTTMAMEGNEGAKSKNEQMIVYQNRK